MFKSYSLSMLAILCFALFETVILSNITVLPAVPDMVLIASIYISLLNGRGMGEITGFSSGLILDFLSASPFGFNCIFRTLISYIAGFFGGSINFKGFFIPFMAGLFGTLSKAVFIWLLSLFYTSVIRYDILSIPFLFELVSNAFLSPIVFKLMDAFSGKLSVNKEDINR